MTEVKEFNKIQVHLENCEMIELDYTPDIFIGTCCGYIHTLSLPNNIKPTFDGWMPEEYKCVGDRLLKYDDITHVELIGDHGKFCYNIKYVEKAPFCNSNILQTTEIVGKYLVVEWDTLENIKVNYYHEDEYVINISRGSKYLDKISGYTINYID